MAQKKLRILLAESSDGETADTLRALFDGNEDALELAVVATVATLIPTIRMLDPEISLLDLSLSLRDPLDAVHLFIDQRRERLWLCSRTPHKNSSPHKVSAKARWITY